MKNFEELHREHIIERLLKDYLEDGTVPTVGQLEQDLKDFLESHPSIEVPLSAEIDTGVKKHEPSSASSFNEFCLALQRDIRFVYGSIFQIWKENALLIDRWQEEYGRLNARLAALERTADGLLLVARDTAGYFHTIEESFTSLDSIDLDNTTARLNIDGRYACLPDDDAAQRDLTNWRSPLINYYDDLREKGLAANLYSINSNIQSSYYGDLTDALGPGPDEFTMILQSPSEQGINSNLDIQVADMPIEINQVDIDIGVNNAQGAGTMNVEYSADGRDWHRAAEPQTINSPTSFMFRPVRAKHIRVTTSTPGPESVNEQGMFVYEVVIRAFFIYNRRYSYPAQLQSNALPVVDTLGNAKNFSKVALQVCEEISEDTNIEYYISAYDSAAENWTSFRLIEPVDRKMPLSSSVLYFDEVTDYDNYSTAVSSVFDGNSSNSQKLLISRLDSGSQEFYPFRNTEDVPLNFYISTAQAAALAPHISNAYYPSLKVYRNAGDRTTTTAVRNVESGWRKEEEDSYYTTYFLVEAESGMEVDFGPSQYKAQLDEAEVEGVVIVGKGVHKFKTHETNWRAVAQDVASETALRGADPLYPYNHKLLIEGYEYPSAFEGERVYKGADKYFEYRMKRVPESDMVEIFDESNLDKFALVELSDGKYMFLVKYINRYPDAENEAFEIEYKVRSTNTYTQLKLKAVFRTTDNKKTPVLRAYRIKVAD